MHAPPVTYPGYKTTERRTEISVQVRNLNPETLITQRSILTEHTQKKDSPVKKRALREVDQNIHLGKSTSRKDLNKDCESNSNLVSTVNVEQIVLNSDDQEDIEKLINIA